MIADTYQRAVSPAPSILLHATSVALGDRAVLITGPSGSGKSALALEMMAAGAVLVADDRTCVTAGPERLWVSPPAALAGWIEARGMGLLRAAYKPRARLVVVAELGTTETARLPEARTRVLLGRRIAQFHKPESGGFAAALLQYLKMDQER